MVHPLIAALTRAVCRAIDRSISRGHRPNVGYDVRVPLSTAFARFTVTHVGYFLNYLYRAPGQRRGGRLIKRSPGSWLLKIADSVCRKSTSDLIIPMVADMRVEYFDLLKDGRRWRHGGSDCFTMFR